MDAKYILIMCDGGAHKAIDTYKPQNMSGQTWLHLVVLLIWNKP